MGFFDSIGNGLTAAGNGLSKLGTTAFTGVSNLFSGSKDSGILNMLNNNKDGIITGANLFNAYNQYKLGKAQMDATKKAMALAEQGYTDTLNSKQEQENNMAAGFSSAFTKDENKDKLTGLSYYNV